MDRHEWIPNADRLSKQTSKITKTNTFVISFRLEARALASKDIVCYQQISSDNINLTKNQLEQRMFFF